MFGGFLEAGDVHVSDAWLDHEMEVDAVAGNLVAHDSKLDWVIGAFAQHGDADRRALWPFEQVSDVRGAHVVSRLAVNGGDNIAGPDAGAIGRGPSKRRDDDDLIIARANGHTAAVVLAPLFFPQSGVRLRIKEIRVRIELVQHARYGAVVDGLVGIYRVSVVLLNLFIDFGELLHAVADFGIGTRSRSGADPLREEHAKEAEESKDEKN